MKKFLSLILLLSLCFLYYFNTNNSLVIFAKNWSENITIINDDECEELILINKKYLEDFLSKINLEVYNKINLNDRVVIEGYTSNLRDYVVVNNSKINIQISICDDSCLIGYPLIKNSF